MNFPLRIYQYVSAQIMRVCALLQVYSLQTFNETDGILQTMGFWPEVPNVDFFASKLKFQIKHGQFRQLVSQESVWKLLDWYDKINAFMIDYIAISVKDSDVSFYRLLLGFKNLLRCIEFTGKSSFYGLR